MKSDSIIARDLFAERCLFHLHTRFTDGELCVRDYFEFASAHAIDNLVFLEHIRRQPNYSVDAFVSEVQAEEGRSHVRAAIGFETKILLDGTLDISDEHFRVADVVGIAEHGFPSDPALLTECLFRIFDACAAWRGRKHFVWVHPGLSVRDALQGKAVENSMDALVKRAGQCGVRIERNLRYDLVSEDVAGRLSPEERVIGADAHKWSDLERMVRLWTQP